MPHMPQNWYEPVVYRDACGWGKPLPERRLVLGLGLRRFGGVEVQPDLGSCIRSTLGDVFFSFHGPWHGMRVSPSDADFCSVGDQVALPFGNTMVAATWDTESLLKLLILFCRLAKSVRSPPNRQVIISLVASSSARNANISRCHWRPFDDLKFLFGLEKRSWRRTSSVSGCG